MRCLVFARERHWVWIRSSLLVPEDFDSKSWMYRSPSWRFGSNFGSCLFDLWFTASRDEFPPWRRVTESRQTRNPRSDRVAGHFPSCVVELAKFDWTGGRFSRRDGMPLLLLPDYWISLDLLIWGCRGNAVISGRSRWTLMHKSWVWMCMGWGGGGGRGRGLSETVSSSSKSSKINAFGKQKVDLIFYYWS